MYGFSVLSTQAQIYVDASATGAINGSSWSNAYTDLQPALDAASERAEIRLAAGTYKPTATPQNKNLNSKFSTKKNLTIIKSVRFLRREQDSNLQRFNPR